MKGGNYGEKMTFNYFYGTEADLFSFYRIPKALGMQISDINNEKLYIAACNGDWNAYQGLVTGAAFSCNNICQI